MRRSTGLPPSPASPAHSPATLGRWPAAFTRPTALRRWLVAAISVCCCATSPAWAQGEPRVGTGPELALNEGQSDRGRPTVKLDHLEFPAMLGGKKYERYLRQALKREVREVDWGASSDSTIEYRFFVKELNISRKGDAIVVSCYAYGRLPRGRSAKSQLSFGGDPRQQSDLVKRVLRIVARGVVTRLAEMERVRRGELRDTRVITPPS